MRKSLLENIFVTALSILILGVLLSATAYVFCACQQDPKEVQTFYILDYKVANGGYVTDGNPPRSTKMISQKVEQGKDAAPVVAVADKGYYFVKWSDGVTASTRCDANVQKPLRVTAEFAPITDGVTIRYKSNIEINPVSYDSEQTVQRGTDGWTVKASTFDDFGLIFIRWSDGSTDPVRQEKNVTEDVEVTAIYGAVVTYTAEHGRIIGAAEQIIDYADSAEPVTAVPEKGYTFTGWSDGVKTPTRRDKGIVKHKKVVANFEWRETDYFAYNYNFATDNFSQDYLTVSRGQAESVRAVIPQRDYFDFGGWYLDEKFQQLAFDAQGEPILGEEVFGSPSRDLYAKWTLQDENVPTYKILMVYVTAVDGIFVDFNGDKIAIHSRMTDSQRIFYDDITKMFCQVLNDMLDGLVKFEVDSYYTTQIIDDSCFVRNGPKITVYADDIPELRQSGVLDDYRSVITTNFFDVVWADSFYLGLGNYCKPKYGYVELSRSWFFRAYEELQNGTKSAVSSSYRTILNCYVDALIDTIATDITCYSYQPVPSYTILENVQPKLYLLNQWADGAEDAQDGDSLKDVWSQSEKVGIPHSYWTNEIFNVVAKPECINPNMNLGWVDLGGRIDKLNTQLKPDPWYKVELSNSDLQRVPRGSRTSWLSAVAKPGYKFIGWSDGCTDELRVITDVQEDITLIAYFERLSYSIEYLATEGGHVEGQTTQGALTGELYSPVIAVADEGYRFVGWSDSVKTAKRQDKNVIADITVTAQFTKIQVPEPPHTCESVCPICNKCLNKNCAEEACKAKCTGHTPPHVCESVCETCHKCKNADCQEEACKEKCTCPAVPAHECQHVCEVCGKCTNKECTEQACLEKCDCPVIPPHTCESVCPTCGKCLNKDCTEDACKDKCTGHTPPHVCESVCETCHKCKNETCQEEVCKNKCDCPVIPPHTCSSICPTCQKCLNKDCAEEACLEKCGGHEEIPPRTYTITYDVGEGGILRGKKTQLVKEGQDGTEVRIEEKKGYQFWCWSDAPNKTGARYSIRKETNVTQDIAVTAIYKPCSYHYSTEGTVGALMYKGEVGTYFEVVMNEDGTFDEVTAIVNEGDIRFIGWSDGVKTATRRDTQIIAGFQTIYACFEQTRQVSYSVNDNFGGTLTGNCEQVVACGTDTEPVTAVADEGYVFAGWSDMLLDSSRYETDVWEHWQFVAFFELIEKTFTYNYNGASQPLQTTITINRDELTNIQFAVPEKAGYEFCGWYLEPEYKTKVADENGKYFLGRVPFSITETQIYARWKNPSENSELPVYKILMIIVDEVDTTRQGHQTTEMRHFHYKMTGIERLTFSMVTRYFAEVLQSWIDYVKFEVDYYYTTTPITDDTFWNTRVRDLFAEDISEVKEFIPKYCSFITTAGLGDYDHFVYDHGAIGTASKTYGQVFIEHRFYYRYKDRVNVLPDYMGLKEKKEEPSNFMLAVYLHEFTHTIDEWGSQLYHDYRNHVGGDGTYTRDNEITRLYLRNEATIHGKTVGIDKELWEQRCKKYK